jgi:hypothetical protein
MLSSVPVSFAACTRSSSWRMQQLAGVQCKCGMAQHVLYRSDKIRSSLAAVAVQEAAVKAAVLLQVESRWRRLPSKTKT